MSPPAVKLFLLLLPFVAWQHGRTDAFWLTDGIAFVAQQQPAVAKDSAAQTVLVVEPKPELSQAAQSGAGDQGSASRAPELVDRAAGGSASAKSAAAGAQPATQPNAAPPATTTLNNNSIYSPASQCPTDWPAESQTNNWLNKWLTSEAFCNQVRLAISAQANSAAPMSNSTGATRAPPTSSGVAEGPARHGLQHSNSNSGAKRRAWFGLGGATNKTNAGGPRHHSSAASSRAKLQLPAIKLVPGERGPKGERGERGPSYLVSVRDREALFDLAAAGETADERRLAFVESEQMLVVNTSLGWRPVQLLAPLSDFRKTIAKFNLNNPSDRRKLLLLKSGDGPARADNDDTAGRAASNQAKLADKVWKWAPNRARRIELSSGGGGGASFGLTNGVDLIGNDIVEEDDADDDDEEEEEDEDDVDEDDENSIDLDEDEAEDETPAVAGAESGTLVDDDDDDDDDEPNSISPGNDRRALADRYNANARNNLIASRAPKGGPADSAADNNQAAANGGGGKRHQRAQASSGRPGAELQRTGARLNQGAKKLRLIALNEPISGNVHGLRGANFECKRNAAKANIRGAFRAFLATNYQSLNEIVRQGAAASGAQYPVVNLRNEILANSWADLFRQPARMANPLSRLYSFDGRHVATDSKWPNKLVWHGAGSRLGQPSSAHNCDGWHSDSMSKFGFASPLHSPRHFAGATHGAAKRQRQRRRSSHNETSASSEQQQQPAFLDSIDKYPCRMPLVVLCIETVAQAAD